MHSTDKKVAIIGMGAVGSGIAYALMLKNIADELIFIDINQELANAEMLDIRHGIPRLGRTKIRCGTYQDIKDCDLIIITAGRSRQKGETRLDLAEENVKITENIAKNIELYYNKGVILIVSNPVDVITYYLTKRLGLERGKIFGTGCILDSSRLVNVISDYIKLDSGHINISIIGEHGNTQIPVWSNAEAAHMPIDEYCIATNIPFGPDEKSQIEKKVRNMGTEIIAGKGKTFYGISTCVCFIADAILNNKTITASVSSVLQGEYEIKDVALSVPSLINQDGIKLILPVKYSVEEISLLKKSAEALKFINNKINIPDSVI